MKLALAPMNSIAPSTCMNLSSKRMARHCAAVCGAANRPAVYAMTCMLCHPELIGKCARISTRTNLEIPRFARDDR